jgi:hypothetical protein
MIDTGPLKGKSMHAIGLMIESRDVKIRDLTKQLAEARAGGQPASKVRDMILPVLKRIEDEITAGNIVQMQKLMSALREALARNIPTAEPPSDKRVDKGGIKPYKSLDHGPRDNEAAASQYRTMPR